MTDAIKSMLDWIASDRIATEPVSTPATAFNATKAALEAIDIRAAFDLRDVNVAGADTVRSRRLHSQQGRRHGTNRRQPPIRLWEPSARASRGRSAEAAISARDGTVVDALTQDLRVFMQPQEHGHARGHGHSHGLIDRTITRSREGLEAVEISLGVLLATSILQTSGPQGPHCPIRA